MNHLMIFLVFVILSLRLEPLSCRLQGQNLSDTEQILVESFKKKLLKELGFSTVPNISAFKPPKIPQIYKYLVEEENRKYNQMAEEEDDGFYAKTKRIFLFPEQADIGNNYLFKLKSEYKSLEIKSATLWVPITEAAKSVGETDHGTHELDLYRGYESNGEEMHVKEYFHSKQLNTTGWYSVDMSFVAKEWFSLHPAFDLSLGIAIKGTKVLEVGGISGATEPMQPFLAVNTEEMRSVNRKRRASHSDECDSITEPSNCCRRYNLEINFESIGWNFIIAPKTLKTSMCVGVCPKNSRLFSNELRAQVFINADKFLNPCCQPERMANVSILYFETIEKIRLSHTPMKVLSCRCKI